MNLHLDQDRLVCSESGIRLDVLEKGCYITPMLKELAGWQEALPAYFKGGTALYKALGESNGGKGKNHPSTIRRQ